MKVTPPHTRLAPWRRIAGITNPDTSLPPGVDPSPEDPDADPIDRGSDEQGASVVSLSDTGPVTLVQSVSHGIGGPDAPLLITADFDSPPTAGNALILILGGRGAAPVNTPAGFTLLVANTFAGVESVEQTIVAKVSDGTEQTVTFDNTSSGAPESAILSEWTGFGGAIPTADTSAVDDVTNDDTPAIPAITPTSAIPALLLASVWKKAAGPNPGPSTLSGYTLLDDTGYIGLGNRHRLTTWYQVVDPTSGTYGPTSISSTGDGTDDSNVIHLAMETTPDDAAWVIPEPLVNDGDDATYEVVDGTELLRIDLGAPFDITRTRIRIATTTSGARTFTIKGANTADFSDEVTLTSIDFTATGGLAVQDVTGDWSPPEDYRYFQLDIDDADTYRIHTWELFEDPPPAAVDDHGELTGLGDDDHPQYLRVRDGGGDQVSTIGATGAAETIDLANGNVHQLTLDANCTLTFSGAAAGRARSFRLYLWQDGTGGWTVTWPGSVEWAGGAPTLDTDPDTLSVFMFETLDGGTIWHGYPIGGGGGSSTLDGLTDVDTTGVADQDVLAYDLASTTWVPVAPGTPALDYGEDADISTLDYDDVPAGGASAEVARADHVHGMPSASAGGSDDPMADVFGTPTRAFEFDTSSLTGLTAMATAADTEDADTTVPDHLFLRRNGNATYRWVGRYLTPPTEPFTAITKVNSLPSANFHKAAIFVGVATPGNMDLLCFSINTNRQISLERDSQTAFSAVVSTGFTHIEGPLYLAIRANSSTSYDYLVSSDGRVWRALTAARNPSLTIASVGIAVNSDNATIPQSAAFDFLRVWNTAKAFPGV